MSLSESPADKISVESEVKPSGDSVEGTVDRLSERGTLAIKHNRPKLYIELECPHCGGLIHEGLHSRDGTLGCIRFVHRKS